MPTVLLTGGDGALGSSVANHLRLRGYDVVCGTRRGVTDATHCHLDVTTYSSVSAAIQTLKPGVVVHLAATFENDYEQAYATNVLGAKHILSAVKESGYSTRVVLAGSAAEYGLVSPEENPVRECQVLRPVSTYGLTKSWQTNYGLMCSFQGMDVVVARIFNLDGPGLSDRLFVGRINQQIQDVLAGSRQRIEVGSLSAVRDYISIDEAALQLVRITERGGTGEIYHVASGRPIKMRDFLQQRLNSVGLSLEIVAEAPALSSRTGYDVPVIYADISRTVALMDE
ncbi:NAD-dependent epimerase/dehydratase family protein [Pseudomonas izuensis]|uniref:NAD-dependent epimerase/dehydratase family protein n=1 Tax=Pseudomonas izuensis TaxID=2684212 RepID=UPI00135A8F73|nr:NAD-dependent epimerase/dehydratase family protein [Pseudomonas izuensis]